MNWIKKHLWIVLPIITVFLGFLPVVLYNHSILIFGGDSYHQMYQFYQGGYELIKQGKMASFLFELGLGTNVMALVYYLASPFFLLALLLTNKEFIQYTFLYFNEIKIVLIFIFTYIWISQISKHTSSKLIASFTIAFGGWVFSYLHLNMFLDAFLLYPLVLYFIEKYLKQNKILGLCLTLGAIGIMNYYFLYMLLPFACLYALIRYLEIKKPEKLMPVLKDGLKFVGYCLLGVGIACVVIIPVAYMLKSNPRFSEYSFGLLDHLGKNELFKIVSSIFVPVLNHEDTNLFIGLNHYEFIGWGGGASLYSFVITIILVCGIGFLKNKTRKKVIIGSLVFLLVIMLFKNVWLLLQFNMESRWFYMISFILVFGLVSVNDEIEDGLISKKSVLPGCVIAIVGMWGCFGASYLFNLNDQAYLTDNLYILVVLSVLVIGYALYYLKIKKQWLLVGLLMFEAIFSMRQLIIHDTIIDYRVTDIDATYNQEVVDYLHNDHSFYRVMTNEEYFYDNDYYFQYTTSNTPFASGYNGLSFYSTIYNSQQEPFLSRLKNNWQMDQRYTSWQFYNMLSTKYYYAYSDVKALPFGYDLIEQTDNYSIYQNKYWVELGYTYDKTISQEAFDKLPYLEQDMCMSDYLVTQDSNNNTYTNDLEYLGSVKTGEASYFEITPEQYISNANLYLDVGTTTSFTVELFDEEQSIYSNYFYQYNYLDLYIPQDAKVTKIVIYNTQDNPNQDIRFYKKDLSDYDAYFNQRFAEHFTNVSYNKDYISGDITINNNEKWVYTSIAYDSGWDVYIDGEKVEKEMVQLGFIGFKCPEGDHHIEFRYHIPYFNVGVIVSCLSLLILILIYLGGKCGKEKTN